jgi:hypothetical protein
VRASHTLGVIGGVTDAGVQRMWDACATVVRRAHTGANLVRGSDGRPYFSILTCPAFRSRCIAAVTVIRRVTQHRVPSKYFAQNDAGVSGGVSVVHVIGRNAWISAIFRGWMAGLDPASGRKQPGVNWRN